ncbi:DUF805 domain-containing protein [Pseudocolwellia agarivorans]|uniref:DUF805 domain-containing protein n=1 Tax=Pseudocolwellia agarivorans TaxID=1911682 RepID=UPI003F883DEA
MEYYIDALKKYADFTGRTPRKAYWMYILFYFVIMVVLSIIDYALGTVVLANLFSFAMLIPSITITARRLHDTTRSGWWQLLFLVPFIGIIIMLYFLIQGSDDANDYGQNPKNN